jgi:hypothetical protein
MHRDGRVKTIVAFEERRRGRRGAVYTEAYPAGDCYLRLEHKGRRFFGAVSSNGSNWHRFMPIDTVWPAKLRIGLLAINSSAEPFSVRFEDFLVNGKQVGPGATPSTDHRAP